MTLLDYRITESNLLDVDGLTAHVGNTPLLPLRRLSRNLSPRTQVFAKAEWFNPGGSIKDRPDRKSTRLNSSHIQKSRMPSSA